MPLTLHNQHTCFGGTVGYYSHPSDACNCEMRFAVFVPPQAQTGPVPVLFYLSGLTCTEDNFTSKAGAQRYAAEHGLMLVAPDTSPRGAGVPDESDAWDFGIGAGFYVDATEAPWSADLRRAPEPRSFVCPYGNSKSQPVIVHAKVRLAGCR